MTSKAEAITQAVVAALTTPAMTSVSAARVYRDLQGALAAASLPAIAVETGDEEEAQRTVIGYKMRAVEIRVSVLAAASLGASPYTAADAAVVESFNRLSADPTLGGLAFEFDEGPTARTREDAEQNIGSVTKSYRYQYRTTEASIEA